MLAPVSPDCVASLSITLGQSPSGQIVLLEIPQVRNRYRCRSWRAAIDGFSPEMAEQLIAAVYETAIPNGIGGSNPPLSAIGLESVT
jgi:hypothetical protein